MVKPITLMLVDDDPLEGRILRARLKSLEAQLHHVEAVPDSERLTGEHAPAMILLDHDVPPTGEATGNIQLLRQRGYDGPVVIYTNLDPQALTDARGHVDVVSKNVDPQQLVALVEAQSGNGRESPEPC